LVFIAYKSLFGVEEIVLGVVLLIPSFDILRLPHHIVAEEVREDPTNPFVALLTRHLPTLLQDRISIGVVFVSIGAAKLVAATGMWMGRSWVFNCSLL
jgi:uncharacterized membrane protein